MPKYLVSFTGRTRGAIGIVYPITLTIEANTPEDAKRKVYDTHDPYLSPTATEIRFGTEAEYRKLQGDK